MSKYSLVTFGKVVCFEPCCGHFKMYVVSWTSQCVGITLYHLTENLYIHVWVADQFFKVAPYSHPLYSITNKNIGITGHIPSSI